MQDLCVTATRDHNVYASFRPSIATKDAETRCKMNTDFVAVEEGGKHVLFIHDVCSKSKDPKKDIWQF